LGVYRAVGIDEITSRIEHIRNLHRLRHPVTEQDRLAHARREQKIKDFLSNLKRTGVRPMVPMVHELEELCSLSTGGGYRLFGYELDAIREYDRRLNAKRTHIVESHIFERDTLVELPLELAEETMLTLDATLRKIVPRWQKDVPIRYVAGHVWRQPSVFYVHVGTEDSLGSSIPAGALAQVQLIGKEEEFSPRPTTIYLFQFPNGYRFSRCVLSQGKLQLLSSNFSYQKKEEFSYPGDLVRMVGKVLSFALQLPQPEHPTSQDLSAYDGTGSLRLPWEHKTRGSYLTTKFRRFVRTKEELRFVRDALQLPIHASERTKRRYRGETPTEPHVDVLIESTVETVGRFTDALRTGGYPIRDTGRFTLEALLHAKHYDDLLQRQSEVRQPLPEATWRAIRGEMAELTPLLLMKFPNLSRLEDRLVRVAHGSVRPDLQPYAGPGSWMLLEDVSVIPDAQGDALKLGWARPLYLLQQELKMIWGYLERNGASYVLLPRDGTSDGPVSLGLSEMKDLRRIGGMVVRVL